MARLFKLEITTVHIPWGGASYNYGKNYAIPLYSGVEVYAPNQFARQFGLAQLVPMPVWLDSINPAPL